MRSSTRTSAAASILAVAGADFRLRQRSWSTLVALACLFVMIAIWIPDPSSGSSSISWLRASDGVRVTSVYTVGFLATISGLLWSFVVSLAGWYLVAGARQRDARSGVGLLIASTPLTRAGYVLGSFVGRAAFLLAMTAIAVAVSGFVVVTYGTEPFRVGPFAATMLLLSVPAVVFTAALAVLFDVLPATSGRGGSVLFFFAWTLLVLLLPSLLHQGIGATARVPGAVALYDPAGYATVAGQIYRHVADVRPGSLATGRQSGMRIDHVVWHGLRVSPTLVAARVVAALWALPLLMFAMRAFDRFDPAAATSNLDVARDRQPREAGADARAASWDRALRQLDGLVSTSGITSAGAPAAFEADVRLVWTLAPRIKWLWLASSFAVAIAPQPPVVAVFLLLAAPVIADAGAAEDVHGTFPFVRAQPEPWRMRALWKICVVITLLLVVGSPALAGAALRSPSLATASVSALGVAGTFAIAASILTNGNKLFLAVYTVLWYVATSTSARPLDVVAPFRSAITWPLVAVHLAGAGAFALVATTVEWSRAR